MKFVLGMLAGTALMAALYPAKAAECCERVAFGARDKIAGYAGPFGSIVSGLLDATGATKALPGLLQRLGVPTNV